MKYIYLLIFLVNAFSLFSQENNDSFYKVAINTGERPECIACASLYNNTLDNFLRIDATGATDVVIKIINSNTHECIRTVFISSGSVYEIKNIPEGIYYLKIAYGYEWSKKAEGSYCYAKFLRDAIYQEGNDHLDYYKIDLQNGYQLPSYELVLKVISNNRNNEFDADNISEEEFYR
ncbi:MAG: hypothetical protein IPM96_21785 [Ignavibacteria bacterium]|nr:hypothetical protein [Ignavibacteria bacterium]